MLNYYLWLGWRNLRRNPVLTTLMVLILAIGVAASVSTLTILHVMSADPIPQKSQRLFTVELDSQPLDGYTPGSKPDYQLSYQDVRNFLASPVGVRKAGLYTVQGVFEAGRADLGVSIEDGMAASRELFGILEIPMLHGQIWQAADDEQGRDVVVLSRALAEKMFSTTNAVGRQVKLWGAPYQVIGVYDDIAIRPRFYQWGGRSAAYLSRDKFVVPLKSALGHEVPHSGSMSCSGRRDPSWEGLLNSECTWMAFWFEMESAAQRQQLQSFLDAYTAEQHKLGRFPRQARNWVLNVREWLIDRRLIGDDSQLSAWLALGFLMLCLINTIGLMLAKFSARAPEVGVRRALGASQRDIFSQFLLESVVVGLVGSLLGVLLALGALALIALQSRYLSAVAHMDWQMLLATVAMSVTAAVLAGLLPTWRACQITPAIQLKSQ